MCIDVCNYILQLMTTINKIWNKMRQLQATSSIMSQTCPMGEGERKFPLQLPEDAFFRDSTTK